MEATLLWSLPSIQWHNLDMEFLRSGTVLNIFFTIESIQLSIFSKKLKMTKAPKIDISQSMKSSAEIKNNLGQVTGALARIHKTLLENAIEEREIKLNLVLGPADRLNVLLNDPELAWLRALSQLIASVDEVYFQKEDIQMAQWEKARKSVEDLMINSMDSDFSKKYRSLLPNVPDLMPQHGLLRMALK